MEPSPESSEGDSPLKPPGSTGRGRARWQKLSMAFHGQDTLPQVGRTSPPSLLASTSTEPSVLPVADAGEAANVQSTEEEDKPGGKPGDKPGETEHVPSGESAEHAEQETGDEKTFKKGMTTLRFLVKMRAGEKLSRERREEEEFVPESRRRFLFDDRALKKGASLHQLFKDDEPPEEDFNDVVDQDDARVENFVSQVLVGNLIDSFHFRMFIMGLICVNSVLIGLQTDETLSSEYRYVFSIFDQAVLATFTCELLLKWYYGFWIFWKTNWNILDFVIIVALVLGPQLTFLSSSRILRILRVLRAFRSLRSVSALAGLSMVVQTILQSVPDMANIVLLLFIILLVLGVSGVTLFGRQIPERFGELQSAMFSLFICVTQDGWVEIYNEFVKRGKSMRVQGAMYFFISIMVGAFIFANLVVAVVVTNLEMAMKELKEEKEAQVDTMATSIKQEADQTISGADVEKAPVLGFEELKKNADFCSQTPLQKGELKTITLAKMERYCLTIAALEANLAEYLDIKNDLKAMYDLIKELNTVADDGSPDDDAPGKSIRPTHHIDAATFQRGDILSNLMRLEESRAIDSEDAHTMDSVIRSAAGKQNRGRNTSMTNIRMKKAGRKKSVVG